ncbi:MAG: glycosyltransferase family 4 protein [bacterium]
MKIAMIGQKGIPALFGGIERYAEELSVRLAAHGHEVTVFCRSWYSPLAKNKHRGVNLIHTTSVRTKHLDAITHTFFSLIKASRMNLDVIHIHGVGPALLSWIPKIMSPRTKIVITFHCIDRKHAKWGLVARLFLRLGELAACTFADSTITVSKSLHQYCIGAYETETNYIPSGVDEAIPGQAKNLKVFALKPKEYFLFVGRLVAHKRVHDLIQVWLELRETHAELMIGKKLAIVGGSAFTEDYISDLHKLAANDQSIVFTDYQTNETLSALFTHALAVVNPSESEGLPIATIEAMSYGRPVIASDIAENMELIANHGIPFKVRDNEHLKEKILWVLNHSTEADIIGEKAREFVRHEYNIDTMVEKVERVYQE